MPKIPTFTSEARPTAQVGSVKANLQIPLSQTITQAVSPLTDFVVKKAVQSNDTQNRTEALTLENDFIRDMQTVNETIANDSVLGVNKEAANAYYKEQSNSLINKYKNQATNNASQTLFQNNALGEVQKGMFRIEKQVDKNVFTQLNNQVDQKENHLLSQAILGDNNEFDYGVLQTDLTKLYTDAFTGKIPAPELNKIINNIPSLVQGFQANKDIGDNPRLAYLELNKGTNSDIYPDLNLDQRQKLIQQADRILTDQLRTQWKNVLAGSAVGKKVEFDMELAKKVLPQIEVNQMLQGQEIITTTADNKKIIFTSNNKDISTLVEEYSEQAVLQAGEANGQIIAQEYQKAAQTRVKAIEDDSAAYVYSHYPELIELNEEFNNETDNELKTQLKRQITTKILEIQNELGVQTTQQRVMTKAEAENFVANYQKTAQGNAVQSQILLQSITTNFGDNDSKALQELQAAGLPITASLAMTVFSPLEAQKAFGLDSKEEQEYIARQIKKNKPTIQNPAKTDYVPDSTVESSDFVPQETGDRPTEVQKYFGYTPDQLYEATSKHEWRGDTPKFSFVKVGEGFSPSGRSSAFGPVQIVKRTLTDPQFVKLLSKTEKSFVDKITAAQTLNINLQLFDGSASRSVSTEEGPKGRAALEVLGISPQEFLQYVKEGYFLPSNKSKQEQGIPPELLPDNAEKIYKNIYKRVLQLKSLREESSTLKGLLGSYYGHQDNDQKENYANSVIENLQ